jgi:competence ComEA-like helix-hairpin-helix protein
MATKGEQRVFAFLLIVGGLGIVARWIGVRRFDQEAARALVPARSGPRAPWGERALAAQQRAVDSVLQRRNATRDRPPKRSRRDSSASLRVAARRQGPDASNTAGNSTDYAGSVIPSVPRPVDINRATAAELEGLPRVGPALARRIIERRTNHGPFRSLDDLRHVRGIGPATALLVAPLVTFSGRHSPLHSEGHL